MNHFYVAVTRDSSKLPTLLELLELLSRSVPGLPLAVFCATRDALDELLTTLLQVQTISLAFLHSDQSEQERCAVLQRFYAAVQHWQSRDRERSPEAQEPRQPLRILVTTDACAPPIHQLHGEHSLQARLLINFDVPRKKELYTRRISSCFNQSAAAAFLKASSTSTGKSGKSNLNWTPTSLFCVSAAEIAPFRSLEESMCQEIKEMPIHFCEILEST